MEARLVGLCLVAAAIVAVWIGAVKDPIVALAPLPFALTIGLTRRYGSVVAGLLPAVSIVLDGVLVSMDRQTPVRLSTVLVVLLIWLTFASNVVFHRRLTLIVCWFISLVVANYLLIALPTGYAVEYPILALFIEGFLVCVIVASRKPDPELVLFGLVLSGLVTTVFTFFPDYQIGGRPYALGLDPNYLGTVTSVGIAAVATLCRVRGKVLPLLLILPMVAGLVQVQGRSSAVAAGMGLVAAASLSSSRIRGFVVLGTFAALASAAAISGFHPGYGAFTERRIDTVESLEIREQIFAVNIAAAESAPLEGIGLGVTGQRTEQEAGLTREIVSHSEFLRIAAELGFFGLFGAFLLFAVPMLRGITDGARRSPPALMWPALASMLVSMAFLNVLDSAQLATLAMTIAGTGWSAIATVKRRVERSEHVRPGGTGWPQTVGLGSHDANLGPA